MPLPSRPCLSLLVLAAACSAGRPGASADAAPADAAAIAARPDAARPDATSWDAALADLSLPPEDALTCTRTFSCDLQTADHPCGVAIPGGWRYPDQGAPYCGDKTQLEDKCSCYLVRCTSPTLCVGTYTAVFREALLLGCSGRAGMLDGTCDTVWNQIATVPSGTVIADQSLLNVDLGFTLADHLQNFTLPTPGQVTLAVKQDCWFADVSGVGNAGRSEVTAISLGP